MKVSIYISVLVFLVTVRAGFCEIPEVNSVSGYFSYSVEGDWPFGTVSGKGVQLPEPTEVAEGRWALIVTLKDQSMESLPGLFIFMQGKEAPAPGIYPLSFAQKSTTYTAMVIGSNNSIQIISGSGVLDIIVSDKERLEARFEFQAENDSSQLKDAVVKGHFLAVAVP